MIRIEHLHKHYPLADHRILRAVNDVSLTIGSNAVVGLVGESGCGKSTLGKCITGLVDKTSGHVYYDDTTLPAVYSREDFKRWAPHIQMIFQDPGSSLNSHLTIADSLVEPLLLQQRCSRKEAVDKAAMLLEKTGIGSQFLKRYPHHLSGGQKQRVAITRALMCDPQYIICDEPVSALDVSVQAQVIELLRDLRHQYHIGLLFIAHDLAMVHHISDRIAVMYLGSIVEEGPADDIVTSPQHPYTQGLINAHFVADPKLARQRHIAMLQGEPPSPANLPAGCHFAPRCPQAIDCCHRSAPAMIKTSPDRTVRCHLFTGEPL